MESQNSRRESEKQAGGVTEQLSHRTVEESHREAGGVTERLKRVTERHVESQNS